MPRLLLPLLLLTLTACTASPSMVPTRRATTLHNASWNDTPYGMNAFHPNGPAPKGHLAHFTAANLARLKEGDIRWVRLMLDWRYLEPRKGEFYWDELERVVTLLNREQIAISACLYEPPAWALDPAFPGTDWIVKPADLQDFSRAIATRFRDRIAAYELDNEKATGVWPRVCERRASVYVPQLKACYAGVKQGDPRAVVAMAGLWEFPLYYLEDMYRAGAKGHFDAVNLHYYLRADRDPTYLDAFRGDLDLVLKQIDYVTRKYGDAHIPLWVTEYGWPATAESQQFPVGDEKMAQYLTYFLEHTRDSGLVEKAFWYVYYLPDGMALWHQREDRKRPAWHAHKDFQARFPTWANQPVKPLPAPPPALRPVAIPGGDCEDPGLWAAGGGAQLASGDRAPQAGRRYLHVACTQPGAVTGRSFPLEPGVAYELTGYVRMAGGARDKTYAHAMIHLELLGEGDQPLDLLGPRKGSLKDDRSTNYYLSETDGQWHQVHYYVFTPRETRGGRVVLSLGHRQAPAGEADFDSIELKPVDLNR